VRAIFLHDMENNSVYSFMERCMFKAHSAKRDSVVFYVPFKIFSINDF